MPKTETPCQIDVRSIIDKHGPLAQIESNRIINAAKYSHPTEKELAPFLQTKISDILNSEAFPIHPLNIWVARGCDDTFAEAEFIYSKTEESYKEMHLPEKDCLYDFTQFIYKRSIIYFLKRKINPHNKWKPLHDGLVKMGLIEKSEYFHQAMNERYLPEDKRILWTGKKRGNGEGERQSAILFSKLCNFTIPQLNSCFRHHSGKKFTLGHMKPDYPNKKLEYLIRDTLPNK